MKKCPTCGKTFDDAMKFCQSDGTPLTAEEPADVDPFKTMVVSSQDASGETGSGSSSGGTDDVSDPTGAMKTMVVSEDERREMLSGGESASPLDFPAPPEPPKFSEPDLQSPSFGDLSGGISANKPDNFGSSPFSAGDKKDDIFGDEEPPTMMQNEFPAIDSSPTGPIPSPFDASMPPGYQPPSAPPFQKDVPKFEPKPPETPSFQKPEFKDPEPPSSPFGQTPFGGAANQSYNQPLQQQEWTPPPAPEASWQNQDIGQNTPFQPPPANAGQDNTLAIVSLVCGIASILCCGLLTGIPAIITGYIARNRVTENPMQYGGGGMAMAGMILGGISIVLTVLIIILQIAFGALNSIR